MTNIQHSSASAFWYTPDSVLEPARRVLGPIDLDPASDPYGNTRVGAARFFTRDALAQPWGSPEAPSALFINPPGGKVGNKSQAGLFWAKLMDELDEGHVTHAIWVAFSIEQLQISQEYHPRVMFGFPLCIPSRRLKFHQPGLDVGDNRPSHANAIIYVPGRTNAVDAFRREFGVLGVVSC